MTEAEVFATLAATWPPAGQRPCGPITLQDGAGGGKRVSAALATGPCSAGAIDAAEQAMRHGHQQPLFLIRGALDAALDAALVERGYRLIDPVVAYAIAADALPPPPWMTTFAHWPPLAVAEAVWAEGGIDAARLAVMHRASGPRTALIARSHDRVTGAAFVAMQGQTAMLHALEVSPSQRKQGTGQNLLAAAAQWTREMGGHTLSLVVTTQNSAARALYEKCGMKPVAQYHYRQSEQGPGADA
ncbi:MAG: GNAT family N-acetyltransferase [Rhodobacteraceae bacterium]|jgi:GNAT superfamily N-acetyltransferase|nr:GNAT family N-acetyltransferase [Paracoccaceae bacterium]